MGAFTYPRSEPGSGGHQDLVELLNTFTATLRSELSGLPDATLARRPGADEWSIKEVAGHLCDYARFLHQRLYRMIKLEEPRLVAWDQHEQLEKRNVDGVEFRDLLFELSQRRDAIVEMLSDLVHWNWARQGRHEFHGRISIRQLVERAVAHDEAHLEQIRELKAAAATSQGTS
jgi:hypothetical protein